MVHDGEPVGLDGVRVEFDDERAVSDAGVMLVSTLACRLGIEAAAGRLVGLRRDRPGAANAGRKVMALLFAMVLGADSIDDCDVLRAGKTRRLLGGWMPAPSTLGTFLRAFTFGHVRQLDALLGEALVRAWRAGAGPGDGRLVVDVDSFVGEVCGRLKQGAAYGYTKVLGYHPILATRADTREVLHIRLRTGSANTSKGMLRFTDELIARANRAGATGVKLLRADSGFWNNKVFARLEKAGWQYSIGVRMHKAIRQAVEAIEESAWQKVEDYPKEGEAQIAETTHGGRRLIVRRTRLIGPQAELWPDWRHFAFLTNRAEDIALVEAEHRDHAVVEQVIADLKDQALVHFPSGEFNANGAWTVLGALAHNLLRWTQLIGLPDSTVRAARTLRRRLITIAGRLTRHGRCWTLHLPARWPWHGDYLAALARIRALPVA
ncbi:MAG TPA: IS1380 family transposase [Solirubrobacteraceae bacterium]|nr:IS1380 family transposase [Solirubrobacteraceae bacterium]